MAVGESGKATRLFKLILKFPVGGGTYFGGSFQPGGTEIESLLINWDSFSND